MKTEVGGRKGHHKHAIQGRKPKRDFQTVDWEYWACKKECHNSQKSTLGTILAYHDVTIEENKPVKRKLRCYIFILQCVNTSTKKTFYLEHL